MKNRLLLLITFIGIGLSSFAQNSNKSITDAFKSVKAQNNVSYFEVNKEMFVSLSESEASPEFISYVKQLHEIKMIEARRKEDGSKDDLYDEFLNAISLNEFVRLMTSEEVNEKISFYRKKNKNDVYEYILVSSRSIVYIKGTLSMKTLSEFQMAIQIAGSAFQM